jgi:hypothetical protein
MRNAAAPSAASSSTMRLRAASSLLYVSDDSVTANTHSRSLDSTHLHGRDLRAFCLLRRRRARTRLGSQLAFGDHSACMRECYYTRTHARNTVSQRPSTLHVRARARQRARWRPCALRWPPRHAPWRRVTLRERVSTQSQCARTQMQSTQRNLHTQVGARTLLVARSGGSRRRRLCRLRARERLLS